MLEANTGRNPSTEVQVPETAGVTNAPADASKADALGSLLAERNPAPAETPDSVPSAAEAEPSVADDQPVEAAVEESPFDESQLYAPENVQTDFNEDAYSKAAKHWSKQFGREFDPSAPADRAILRELMARGQKISQLQSAPAEPEAEEASEEAAAEETQPQVDAPEQVQKFMDGVNKLAKELIRDEVTLPWVKGFVGSLFGEKVASNLSPEQSKAFAQQAIAGQMLILNDVLPRILESYLPKWADNSFPLLKDMHSTQIEQRALADLGKERDKSGRPLFAEIQKFKDSGALAKVLDAYPWLANGTFKDSKGRPLSALENRKYILGAAYKIARGESASPEALSAIAEKGKQQAARASEVAAASKLTAGESKGAFPQQGNDLLSQLKAFQDGTPEAKVGREMKRAPDWQDARFQRKR